MGRLNVNWLSYQLAASHFKVTVRMFRTLSDRGYDLHRLLCIFLVPLLCYLLLSSSAMEET